MHNFHFNAKRKNKPTSDNKIGLMNDSFEIRPFSLESRKKNSAQSKTQADTNQLLIYWRRCMFADTREEKKIHFRRKKLKKTQT